MVELIMKRMNQVFNPPPKPMRCEVCGGDHPTSQCLPRQNPQPYRAPPRTDKWCDFENKWTNHETAECYHRIRYLREQGMAQQPPQPQHQGQGYTPMRQPNYPTQGMERAQPVLGHQPPLPGATVVRYMQPEDEHHDGTMVPVNYYGEEENEQLSQQASVSMNPQETQTFVPEGQYQMDHNTLWFIANGMARPTGP